MTPPNRFLGAPGNQGFLRAEFYFPWTRIPESANDLDSATKWVFLAARATGFLFLASVVGFVGAIFAEVAA